MNLRKCVTNSQETNDQIKLGDQIEKKLQMYLDWFSIQIPTNYQSQQNWTKI